MMAHPLIFSRRLMAAALAMSVLPVVAGTDEVEPGAKPNVLLICVDDLRCETGCYGVEGIRTPHIDRLAREGRMFSRHFVHAAACGPSRSAMLTSRRTRSWDVWAADRKRKQEPAQPVAMPHLPFVAPQRHWDQYERDAIPPAPHPEPASNTWAAISLHQSYEPTTHYHWPEGPGKSHAIGIWKNGRSIRTDRHRYVEWKNKQGNVIQQELYDLQADPLETGNVAGDHADLVSRMRNELTVVLSEQH